MIRYKLINHTEYNLKERESLLNGFEVDRTLAHVLLSTCNRIEVYWGEGDAPEAVVRHLYRVAAGLESSLAGERAIQGQLKQAYLRACETYRLSPALHRLFQTAIHAGKRVRTETRIAEGAISHSQVTVEILKQENIDLKKKIIAIIGVNKLTEDIVKFLVSRGATNIFLSNRHFAKAHELASRYNGTAISLDDKRLLLQFADVLVCATSAPHLIIHPEDIPEDKDMLIFDLAFPRDVSEEVATFPRIKLFNLEDIERFAKKNISLRHSEIHKAEQIINEEIAKYYQWQSFRTTNKLTIL
ncbi:MAG: glutamyl-tRNA reductase [Tannerella sp.]|jgi:glutamyl-tRNA reductase|nr:glutamyl-tRNA reductase [Tannerella sp.]